MRRPLKPFVTEYKGSNRRGTTGIEAPETDRPRSSESMQRPEAEDSYEAAMRAADALFSSRSAKTSEAHTTEATGETPPARLDHQFDAFSRVPTGRILQAIDEPPSTRFAALEAEYAPKRRGRKPGSKNKPKPEVASTQPENVAGASVPKRRGRPPGKGNAISAPKAIPAIATLAALPNAAPAAASPAKPNGASSRTVARDEKRFSWVRDRLKPGEAWKRRRLPRVCW